MMRTTFAGSIFLLLVASLVSVPNSAQAALLLRYNFDEANSGTVPALDSGTGVPAPGIFNAGATRTGNTPAGNSLGALDAVVDGYVSGGDSDKLDALSTMTFTGWINLQGAPANGNRIFAKQLPSGNFDGFSFALSTPNAGSIAANNFAINLALGGATFGFNRSAADLDADNKWIFVAATYDGSTVQFYAGDETTAPAPLGSNLLAGANPASLAANANEFRVATSSTGTVSAPIWIDDVRVYDVVLDAAALDAVRVANIPEPTCVTLGALGMVSLIALKRMHSRRSS